MRPASLALLMAIVLAAPPADLKAPLTSWFEAHQREIVGELLDTFAIPKVAADTANIRRNADHPRARLIHHGFSAEILETTGNPLVYGTLDVPGATRTVRFYCHYDGQPVDTKASKQLDPFTPVVGRR